MHARATVVTNPAEEKRIFGRLHDKRNILGALISVQLKLVNQRRLKCTTAEWTVGSVMRRKTLTFSHVKERRYPSPPSYRKRQHELPLSTAESQDSTEDEKSLLKQMVTN